MCKAARLARERFSINMLEIFYPIDMFLRYIDLYYLTEEQICFDEAVKKEMIYSMKTLFSKFTIKEFFDTQSEGSGIVDKMLERYNYSSYGEEVFTYIIFHFAHNDAPEATLM